jgi:spermidine synthase
LVLGNSVYGFSLMLAAYLAGIALGSALVSRFLERIKKPIAVLAVLQIGVSLLTICSLHLFRIIGQSYTNEQYTYSQIWSMDDFVRLALHAVVIVFPPTLALGAIFPIASKLAIPAGAAAEEGVGKLYGYNTIGAILGSLTGGFVLVPLAGTLLSFLLASAISLAIAIYLLRLSGRLEGFGRANVAALGSTLVFCLLLSVSFRDPFYAVLQPRFLADETLLAHEEDKAATVTLMKNADGRTLYINGLYVSNSAGGIGELMLHPVIAYNTSPQKVLLVGLGVGDAFRAASLAGMDVTVVELLPTVRKMFQQFAPSAERFLSNPKGHIVIGDGRNFLLSSEERFDYVLVDGTPPVFASGMVNLYSWEFVQIVKDRLTPGGIFAIWFPPTCFEADFWMIVRNFADTFPNIAVFAPRSVGGIIILGTPSKEPIFEVDESTLSQRFAERGVKAPDEYAKQVLGAMLRPQSALRNKASLYPRVTDDRPYTEFPLFSFWKGLPYYSDSKFLQNLEIAGKE